MRKIQFECMRLIAVVIAMFAVSAVVLPAYATTPPTPEVTTVTYINGCFNVAVWYKEGAYPTTSGANLTCTYEIGMKGPGETEWSDVTGKGTFNTYRSNKYRFRCWTMATNYIGSAQYRIRSKDADTSETSDWVELGSVAATAGTALSTSALRLGMARRQSTSTTATVETQSMAANSYVAVIPARAVLVRSSAMAVT